MQTGLKEIRMNFGVEVREMLHRYPMRRKQHKTIELRKIMLVSRSTLSRDQVQSENTSTIPDAPQISKIAQMQQMQQMQQVQQMQQMQQIVKVD